ncbi:MAG: ABC transporter ATP-binding protein [candidate division NC10 bacterium]|nr:ABC transporter ATP-binding protein [candidate division NC10 bacterium]
MADELLLEARGLCKAFGGVRAVDGLCLHLARGEVRALIGPNGAGKTTLFNLLTGQLVCDNGLILFQGERISGLPPHRIWRKGISRTFQITAAFQSLSVLENVQVALLSRDRATHRMLATARRLGQEEAVRQLARVGLADQAERPCFVLSYGDLKRLELAVALANRPVLLLLDEPTAGMAPQERSALMALVSRIVAEEGLTVLFTEHDMDVVFAAAHRITVIHQGRTLAEGTPEAIRGNARVQEIYLGGGGG